MIVDDLLTLTKNIDSNMTKEQFKNFLDLYYEKALCTIKTCNDLEELEKLRVILVGKNGFFTQLQKELGNLIKQDRINS